MLWPKKNAYKEFDNEKKFLRLENSLPPPPHNFSNGPSLINALCRQLSPCGHPAIMNTSIVRTAAKSQAKINHRCLIEITSRYH